MRAWLLSPLGPLPVMAEVRHALIVTADARALLVANGWTPPAPPATFVVDSVGLVVVAVVL